MSIRMLGAGESLLILGRNVLGDWVLVQTSAGDQGWIAVVQFADQLNIAAVPLARQIPTPPITPSDSPPPPATSAGPIEFVLAPGTSACTPIVSAPAGRFPGSAPIQPFDLTNAASISRQPSFQLLRPEVPLFIDVYVEENLIPGDYNPSDNTSGIVSFPLCVAAASSAALGTYSISISLRIGTQSYSQFFEYDGGVMNISLILSVESP